MMWYNIDFPTLSRLLLPTMLRKPFIKDLAEITLNELKGTYDSWMINRKSREDRLAVNGQVCYLQAYLQSKYDSAVAIQEGNNKVRKYIYTHAESKPQFIEKSKPFIIYSQTDYADTGVDFIVDIPSSIKEKEEQIFADVKYYKQDVKRFKIVKK